MTVSRDMLGGVVYRNALKRAWNTPKGSGILGDALTDYRDVILPALDRHYVDATFLTGGYEFTGGFIVKASGELVGVFSSQPGRGDELVDAALKAGATHLDCFDGYLTEFYARHGFIEYDRSANWTPGEPDVVLMGLPSWIENRSKAESVARVTVTGGLAPLSWEEQSKVDSGLPIDESPADYDSRIFTPQQARLAAAVASLQVVIADVVPSTTAHYAIEGLKPLLRDLSNPDHRAYAGYVTTSDAS
jgi:hypothetical protein